MDTGSLLNISQLSIEIDASEAIIKFLVKKFKKLIPGICHKGTQLYNTNDLIILIHLLDKINSGVLPSKIEKDFKNGSPLNRNLQNQLIQTKDSDISAKTIELMEKRNEIEALKLEALNKIAKSLGSPDVIKAINIDQPENINTTKIDDLSKLVDTVSETEANVQKDPEINTLPVDDLAKLIKTTPETIKSPHPQGKEVVETDDNAKQGQENNIDDLSSLLIDQPKSNIDEIDNLSALMPDNLNIKPENNTIDDLSELIGKTTENELKMDDLSQLLEENRTESDTIDDLSILTTDETFQNGTIDDLSSLIEPEPATEIAIPKPEFSPKDDFEKYKSEIINIIIDLKNQGLTQEITCERFNNEGILTFSGKKNWSVKTISQVYELIDNAA